MFKQNAVLPSIIFLALTVIFSSQARAAEERTEAHSLVDHSTITLTRFNSDPNMEAFRDLIKRSRAVIIIPQMLRGGLVVGGTGGSGALMARDMKTGHWLGPAFYSIGSITFGLQIGAEASEVIMVILTDKGLKTMLNSSFKLGADVTIAAGPVGMGTKAATADILAYSLSKGAFGGFTVEGAVMQTKDAWNYMYYNKDVTPADILLRGSAVNPYTENLEKLITQIAAPTSQKVSY